MLGVSATRNKALIVIGGTGVGKTRLGIELCKALNGEVINADAMQLYDGLPIATARPTLEERAGVPHHHMGTVSTETGKEITVREYRDAALETMKTIWSQGKLPIVVGGTLYYVQALLWPSTLLDERPGFDADDVREPDGVIDEALPGETPHQTLTRIDPVRARQLHPHDVRKIARSLQVARSTGKLHSSVTTRHEEREAEARFEAKILWVGCEPAVHAERLALRVDDMLRRGLIDEAREFVERKHPDYRDEPAETADWGAGLFQAMGFRELLPALRATHVTDKLMQECRSMLISRHRQYANKQQSWIKHRVLPRTVPVYKLDATNPAEWAARVSVPALALARELLSGEPSGIPSINTDPLSTETIEDKRRLYHCRVCGDRPIVGMKQWTEHVGGKHHRRAVQYDAARGDRPALPMKHAQKRVHLGDLPVGAQPQPESAQTNAAAAASPSAQAQTDGAPST